MDTNVEDHATHRERVGQFEINLVSYRLGARFYCAVDNVDPGAVVARGQGDSREEAETIAVEKARDRVAKTRTRPVRPEKPASTGE